MYIVEKIESNQKEKNKLYLEYPICIYTIVEDGRYRNGTDDIKVKAFNSGFKWAQEQGLNLEGVGKVLAPEHDNNDNNVKDK